MHACQIKFTICETIHQAASSEMQPGNMMLRGRQKQEDQGPHHVAMLLPAQQVGLQPDLGQVLCKAPPLLAAMRCRALDDHRLNRRPGVAAIPLLDRFHCGCRDARQLDQACMRSSLLSSEG